MAKTPFKLKSGNTSPFKLLGSSPLKQDGPNIRKGYGKVNSNSWLTEHGKKLVQDAKSVKVQSGMPKNFNMTDKDSWVKESKKILSSKTSKTPSTIASRTVKAFSNTPKQLIRQASVRIRENP